ncbi:MAG: TldD/PmbA family protein [Nitrososphaerales archaeon]
MSSEDLASKAIDHALSLGASYADTRFEVRTDKGLLIENGSIEHFASQQESGIGIRVVVDGAWGFYAFANPTNLGDARTAAEQAFKLAKSSSASVKQKVVLADAKAYNDTVDYGFKKDPRDGMNELVQIAKDCDKIIKSTGNRIHRSSVSIGYAYTEKMFMNSDGAKILQRYIDTITNMSATAHESGLTQNVSTTEGGRGGIEMVTEYSDARAKAQEIAEKAVQLIDAKPAKEQKARVVMNPDFVALLAHEILGHPSEADRVLGYEMAWAGGAWWAGKLGQKVGSDAMTVSDNPTIAHSLGHYKYDDEGVRAKEKVLIKNGMLVDHMHSRETASKFNVEANAGMRATGYEFMPLIRMACTYINTGNWNHEEMIKEVDDGVLICNMKVPSIDMLRYNWSISCQYAYMIRNGEVKDLLRDIIVMGIAPEFFASIDACSKDFEIRPVLNCGKGDPMQTMRMGNGGPYVRGTATVKSVEQ